MKLYLSSSLVLPILLTIPVIQLGYSYYLSFAFGVFIYCFARSVNFCPSKFFLAILVTCISFLLKAIANAIGTTELNEILVPIREMLCFLAMIFIAEKIRLEAINQEILYKRIYLLLIILFCLVAFQSYKLSVGEYFGIPVNFFIKNSETLGGVEDALLHQTRFRATAFFGEPSYTSFIVLSLLVVCFELSGKLSEKIKCAVLAIGIVAMSQSIAGVLAIALIIFYWLIFSKAHDISKRKKYMIIVFVALSFAASLYFSNVISDRFFSVIQGGDESSTTRINEPVSLFFNVVSSGAFFGVNYQYIEKFLGYSSLDNALLRLLIYYGFLAIIPLMTLVIFAKKPLLFIYIFLAMNFNGEFFVYDKVLIVALVIGLSNSIVNVSSYKV